MFLAETDLELQIISLATRTVVAASVALIILVLAASVVNKQSEKVKKIVKLPLFILIATTMLGSTGILFAGTVYLNLKSESGGPVHWHAEIEFWACGAEVNLRDPTGFLSNKVGSATYHEHNDKHIHLEGVVVKKSHDASLGKFMEVTGGYILDDRIGIPLSEEEELWFTSGDQIDGDQQRPENFAAATDNGSRIIPSREGPVLELRNGEGCSALDESTAEVQVFKFSYDKDTETYQQEKLANPAEYVMRDESSLGPPSDCIVVEYDTPRARTDKICQQYGIKDVNRCTAFGVSEFNPDLCNIREVNPDSQLDPTLTPPQETNGQNLKMTDPDCLPGSPTVDSLCQEEI